MGNGDAALPVALDGPASMGCNGAAAATRTRGLDRRGLSVDAADSLEPTTARGFFGRVTGFRREPNAGFLVAARRFDRAFARPAACSAFLRMRLAALTAGRDAHAPFENQSGRLVLELRCVKTPSHLIPPRSSSRLTSVSGISGEVQTTDKENLYGPRTIATSLSPGGRDYLD